MTNVDGQALFNLIKTVGEKASLKYGSEFDHCFVQGYMESVFVSVLDSLSPAARSDILADFSKRLMKMNEEMRRVPAG